MKISRQGTMVLRRCWRIGQFKRSGSTTDTPVVTLGFGRGGEVSDRVGREQVGHRVFSLASHNLIMSRSMSDGNTTATAIISPVCDLGNPQPPRRDFSDEFWIER